MLKILSIDDSKAVHAFMEICLPDTTYQLTHAMSAMEGIDLLKSGQHQFSVVLLDWEMPQMSGPEALVAIRQLGFTMPIIMVTTKNDPEGIQDTLDKGATEYIMKPFTPDILVEKIQSVLSGAANNAT
jgi:two-component system, chemotaxis family, chemotaxis protein CheY